MPVCPRVTRYSILAAVLDGLRGLSPISLGHLDITWVSMFRIAEFKPRGGVLLGLGLILIL